MSAQVISMSSPEDRPNIRIEIVLVTPEIAEAWLGKNTANRNINRQNIDKYARDMKAGKWRLNGETVIFADNGRLLDGQNRMHAIIKAGVPVQMLVVGNIPSDAMSSIGTGKSRNFANVLQIDGHANSHSLQTLVRRALLWKAGYRTNSGNFKPTNAEMLDFLEKHPDLEFSAEIAGQLYGRTLLPRSVVSLSHWLFASIDAGEATWFLARIADEDVPRNHPARVLRRRIVAMRLAGGRVNETEALALTIRAWNAFRSGEMPSKFQMPKGGLTNANFPEPR